MRINSTDLHRLLMGLESGYMSHFVKLVCCRYGFPNLYSAAFDVSSCRLSTVAILPVNDGLSMLESLLYRRCCVCSVGNSARKQKMVSLILATAFLGFTPSLVN